MKEAVGLQVSGKNPVITALDEPRASWFDGYDPPGSTPSPDRAVLPT